MGCFDALHFQRIAQGVCHGLRIAKIAHEHRLSSANGGDRSLPCRPVRQWRGRGEKLIRSPSPKGAGCGCIDPDATLRKAEPWCQLVGYSPGSIGQNTMRNVGEPANDHIQKKEFWSKAIVFVSPRRVLWSR